MSTSKGSYFEKYPTLIKSILILLTIYFFLVALDLMIRSISEIGSDTAREFISITENPFISLFVGLLVTVIIQSSSTTTSMIVAMVATGSMNFENAIPMIMGANIGTCLTSTLVSMSFISKRVEYRRAFSVGVVHDIFNLLIAIILFPIEYYFNVISGLANSVMNRFNTFSGFESTISLDFQFTGWLTNFIFELLNMPVVSLLLSVIVLFASIKILSNLLSVLIINESRNISSFIFSNKWKSLLIGVLLTGSVQSSSVTTSLIIPVVAAGRISIKKIFPYIVGANIGTTITALIAAAYISAGALSVALVHLVFNFVGFVLFLLVPNMENIPVKMAQYLGHYSTRMRLVGVIYIFLIYFLIPFSIIYFSK